MYETALAFSSNILGVNFGGANVKVKLRDVSKVDGTSRLSLRVTGKNDRVLNLSFTNSAPAYECLVMNWNLNAPDPEEKVATGPGLSRKKKAKRQSKNIVEYAQNQMQEYRETLEEKCRSFVAEAGKLGAKPRPTPKMPTIDVEDEVSRALFVRLIKANDVLAMDKGGTSDPFASVRYRGLESTSKTVWKTLNPGGTKYLRLECRRIRSSSTRRTLSSYVFDRDVALHDFIGYAKIDLTGTRVYSAKKTRVTLDLQNLPADQQPDFFDMNHLKEKLNVLGG